MRSVAIPVLAGCTMWVAVVAAQVPQGQPGQQGQQGQAQQGQQGQQVQGRQGQPPGQGLPPGGQSPGTAQAGQPPSVNTAPMQQATAPNVKIDVTFVEMLERENPTRKTVSMLVYGTGRNAGRVRAQGTNYGVINIDARPHVLQEYVSLDLTIEYLPETPPQSARPATVTHSVSVLLRSGKPTVVAESADPGSARRVAVEVTATVMK